MTTKTVLLGFAILSIVSQIPCTDYVVKLGSNLNGKSWDLWFIKNIPSAKRIQAGVFSLIIANAIMFTVILGMHWIAFGWMIIEVLIACIYVWASNRHKDKDGRFGKPQIENKIAGYFMAVLIPVCIYSFSFMYVEYEWIKDQFLNLK